LEMKTLVSSFLLLLLLLLLQLLQHNRSRSPAKCRTNS
jgi:hypothetical protein